MPLEISFIAVSKATCAELDFGDRAISVTIVPKGIRASGKPTRLAASIAAITLGPIPGFARPISS